MRLNLIVLYLVLALLVAVLGRRRSMGALGCFLLAVFATPPLAALILALTRTKPTASPDK